jgi:type I restriction enzyme S subunit
LAPYNQRKIIGSSLLQFKIKIELNKQTNQTLEQMAQALFKSWFVDFNPVFDNAFDAGLSVDDFPDELQHRAMIRQQHRSNTVLQGAEIAVQQPTLESAAVLQPQSPQNTQTESERIRGLFPSEFEQCDDPSVGINGWIPKGWEKDSLKSFGKAVTGKTPPSKVQNAFDSAGIPFITPTDVDSDVYALNFGRYLTEEGVNVVKNNIIDEGSVCVTCIGSQMGKTVISSTKAVTNQQLNSIVLSDEFSRNYIFMNLRMRREELFNLGSSGSTMPILNKSSFENLTVLRPSDDVIKTFSKYTENYLEKILVNSKQNKQLENIRDSLLPKLISGEINIPNKDVA